MDAIFLYFIVYYPRRRLQPRPFSALGSALMWASIGNERDERMPIWANRQFSLRNPKNYQAITDSGRRAL